MCSVKGCTASVHAKGFCGRHYTRWRRHGDPTLGGPARGLNAVCSVEGCTRPVRRWGYCDAHAQRWRNHGDVRADVSLRVTRARGTVPHGTRTRYNGGCRCEECSQAMRDYQNARYRANPQPMRDRVRQRYHGDREVRRTVIERAVRRNQTVDRRVAFQRRRNRLTLATVEPVDRLTLWLLDDGICGICADPVDLLECHIDHVIPVSKDGSHSYVNTQVTHPWCNLSKGARCG